MSSVFALTMLMLMPLYTMMMSDDNGQAHRHMNAVLLSLLTCGVKNVSAMPVHSGIVG